WVKRGEVRMFHKLGKIAASYPWIVCLAWIGIGIATSLLAPQWDPRAQDEDISFLPERFTSVRAYRLMEQAFPQEVAHSRLVFALERPESTMSAADLALVDRIVAGLNELIDTDPNLKQCTVCSYRNGLIGHRLISKDGKCTLIQVSLQTPFMALTTMLAV